MCRKGPGCPRLMSLDRQTFKAIDEPYRKALSLTNRLVLVCGWVWSPVIHGRVDLDGPETERAVAADVMRLVLLR